MAADSDPFFAFPSLYGAPAYARPPRAVLETERPLDPDDLPIVAQQTADERVFTATVFGPDLRPSIGYASIAPRGSASAAAASATQAIGSARFGVPAGGGRSDAGEDRPGRGGGLFGLRGLTGRIGSRDR